MTREEFMARCEDAAYLGDASFLEGYVRDLFARLDDSARELAVARAEIRNWQPHEPVERTAYVETLERGLGNLLAIIHRDGGHHTARVGIARSVDDAHQAWAVLVRERDEALAEVEALRMRLCVRGDS